MSHNRGKTIGHDFFNADANPICIKRQEIRAFVFDCVHNTNIIRNLSKKSINIVMHKFKLKEKDRNKIKKIINVIIHRDNRRLPPILCELDSEI